MDLRPYQGDAIDALFAWWDAGRAGEDPLICIPTAGGKTVIFATLIKRLLQDYPGVSVLILAHRQELISQAEAKLKAVWPQAPAGVYAASLGRREIRQVTIASRDTIAPVIDAVGQFTFVIVDEAHRMNVRDEGQYRKLVAKLRMNYPDLVVIGFTATPFRLGQGRIYGDGKPFADLAYRIGIKELTAQGYLSPLTSLAPAAGAIDTAGVKITAGDFNEHQLEERATAEGIIEAAVDEWLETAYQAGRQATVFFCVSLKHAELTRDAILARGVEAQSVSGKTPGAERAALLDAFDRGEFPALCNVGVLTEGWDCTRVDCIALLRPTQSASLYVQMAGRGLRLHPGKSDCLVLDFGGNIERLGPVDEADEREPKGGRKVKREEAPYRRCGSWDPEARAWIDGCGHKNPTAAVQCEECGRLFIRHEPEAKRGGIVSTEKAYEDFIVESVGWRTAISQSTGNEYLRLVYRCGLFEVFYKNLMLGYPGYAGQRALKEWISLTERGSVPGSAEEACRLLDTEAEQLRLPRSITVDVASRWKEIVRFDFGAMRHDA